MSLADKLMVVCSEFRNNNIKILKLQADETFKLITKKLEEAAYKEGKDSIQVEIKRDIESYLSDLLSDEGYSIIDANKASSDCNNKIIEVVPTYKLNVKRKVDEIENNHKAERLIIVESSHMKHRPKPQTGTMKIR